MSSALYRLAQLCFHARRRVVAAWLASLVCVSVLALAVDGDFETTYDVPGTTSQQAFDALRAAFPEAAQVSALLIVVSPEGTPVDAPQVRTELDAILAEIAEHSWAAGTDSPFADEASGMVTDDRRAAYANIRLRGPVDVTFTPTAKAELTAAGARLQERLPGSTVRVGGDVFTEEESLDVSPIEGVGVLAALIVLLITLGSLRAAVIPVVSGVGGAVLVTGLIMAFLNVVEVTATALILALMLALAVGIDYTLFIVSRHRDQLGAGMSVEESATRATATAGSSVVFAGLTVVIALLGLGVAGIPFLTVMGAFAAAAVALEVLLALTLLPAMLGFAGERLRPRVPAAARVRPAPHRFATHWLRLVTARPLVTILIVVSAVGALAYPAKDLQLALPSAGRSLPGAADRVTYDLLSQYYGPGVNGPLIVTAPILHSEDPVAVVDGLRADIEAMPGVRNVALATPNRNADTALIQLIPTTGPDDPATADLVERLRARADEWSGRYGVQTAVTGFTAATIDVSKRLGDSLLPFGAFVLGLSLVLMVLAFRSVWVPVKAAVGYLLSVGGAFGLTALVFNHGLGRELINLAEPTPVISFQPIMLMGVLFGLAMDYEVFLTSRMRESYARGNHDGFVREGFVKSARVVVAAALIMIAVFAFFVPTGSSVIKPIAFSLAAGVAIDAFAVRMTLGPAVMTLLGRHAWWLPGWLARRLPHVDVEGASLDSQLAMARYPQAAAPGSIYALGFSAATADGPLFAEVDLELMPGECLVVTGPALSRRALLLALSGRLGGTIGRARVLGLPLPSRAGTIRRRSAHLEGADPGSWSTLASDRWDLVLVNDADRLGGQVRDQLAVLLAHPGTCSFVLATEQPDHLADLLAPASVRRLEVRDSVDMAPTVSAEAGATHPLGKAPHQMLSSPSSPATRPLEVVTGGLK